MFGNLRYISMVLFFVISLIAFTAVSYLKNYVLKNIVQTNHVLYTQAISKIYQDNILKRYRKAIYPMLGLDQQLRKDLPQYVNFIQETTSFFFKLGVLNVRIVDQVDNELFNMANNTIVEAAPSILYFFSKKSDISPAILAQGMTFASTMIYGSFNGSDQKTHIIKVLILLDNVQEADGSANKNIVLEINYDVKSAATAIEFIQTVLIVSAVLSFAFIVMTIFIMTKKAEFFFEKQQESAMEMAKAKANAEAENNQKSKFLANVSHELRTPLTSIIGFSEMICSESLGPIGNAQYKDFAKDINSSGQHLLSLINDILDYSKAEENKLELLVEEVDLTKMIKICLRMVSTRAQDAKVRLAEKLPDGHIMMHADQKRLKQVLLNLLSNAVKFTPEGGEVSVSVAILANQNKLQIEIKDTGVGMEPQDLAKAMSPFGQIDNKLSRRYEGTGLGLPLTRRLVELMHGTFDLKSEVGLGTTAILVFNIKTPEQKPVEAV